MSEDEKIVALLQRVLDKTVKGELHWESTANASTYTVPFARFSLTLEQVPETRDTRSYILLRLSNDRGQVVEEFDEHKARRMGFEQAADLYDRARRTAMGLNSALDELLTELDDSPQAKS